MGSIEEVRFVVATTQSGISFFDKERGKAGRGELKILDFSREEERQQIESLCRTWEGLRQAQKAITRYNSPVAFQRRAIAVKPDDRQPFVCAMEVDGKVTVIAVGNVGSGCTSYTLGRFRIPYLGLKTLHVGESGVIHSGGQDHLKLLLDRFTVMQNAGCFDLLTFHDVVQGTDWYEQVAAAAGFGERVTSRSKIRWQTQILDPVTGERLHHHGGKTRRNIRQRDKKLSQTVAGDVVLEKIDRSDQLERFIAEAGYIVSQSYQAALQTGIQSDDPAQQAYLHELAREQTLRAYVLRVQGKAIAYTQGDLQAGTLYLWSTAYLPEYSDYAPGIVLMYRVIEDLAEEGVPLLDFGWGDNIYKQRLGSQKLDTFDFRLYGPRLYPRLACTVDKLLKTTDTRLRHFLETRGRMNQLRMKWREWIKAKERLRLPKTIIRRLGK